MQNRIAVASVDIFENSAGYAEYANLSAKNKIDKLAERIARICEEFKKKELNSAWMVSWREDALFEPPDKNSPLSVDTKDYLHKKMGELIKLYPQLTILSGAVTVERKLSESERTQVGDDNKLDKLGTYYAEHQWIEAEEKARHQLAEFRSARQKIKKVKEQKEESITVLSKTAYVYTAEPSGDEKKEPQVKVIKHRKSSPYREARHPHQVFRPASPRSYHPTFKIQHPITKQDNIFTYEICREHLVGTSRRTNQSPLIQFVSSNTIALYPRNLNGDYVIQCDGNFRPRLIVTKPHLVNEPNIFLYQHDLLTENNLLEGPLEPFCPLQSLLCNELTPVCSEYDNALLQLKKMRHDYQENKTQTLAEKNLKQDIMKLPQSKEDKIFVEVLYTFYNKEVKKNYKKFLDEMIVKLEKERNQLSELKNKILDSFDTDEVIQHVDASLKGIIRPPSFFPDPVDPSHTYVHQTAKKLMKLTEDFKNNPEAQRLNSETRAPLQREKGAPAPLENPVRELKRNA